MAKAKKTKSGMWTCLVFVGKDDAGKRQYKRFTAETKKEAEYQAAEYAFKRKKENKAENMTFQKASDRYIESKENLLSPSTIRGYTILQRNAYPMLLIQTLGELAVNDSIQRQMNQNAKKYAAKTIKNQFGFLSAVFKYFHYTLDPVTLKQGNNRRIRVPTETEAKAIAVYLHDSPLIECQALLALTCSLRQSEIAGLTAADIQGSDVFVHGARVPNKNSQLVYKSTGKTDAATRHVTMPEYLKNRVVEWCKKRPTGWLFPTVPDQVLYYFEKLERSHGIYPYTIHSLRHSFAAFMHALNVPDQYVMLLGGWKSDYVLKKVYQYTFQEEAERVKNFANTYFTGIIDATHDATT